MNLSENFVYQKNVNRNVQDKKTGFFSKQGIEKPNLASFFDQTPKIKLEVKQE